MRIINIKKKRPSVTWCSAFNGYFKFVIAKKPHFSIDLWYD